MFRLKPDPDPTLREKTGFRIRNPGYNGYPAWPYLGRSQARWQRNYLPNPKIVD